MTIYHKTLEKAKKAGLTLVEADDGKVNVLKGKTLITANVNAATALEHALELIETAKTSGAAKVKAAAKGKGKAKPKPKAKTAPKAKGKTKAKKADKDEKPSLARTISTYRDRYRETGDSCGDDMAEFLKEATTVKNKDGDEVLDLKALRTIAKENGIDASKYGHLNPGHQRMIIGNILRGMITKGENVKIGRHTLEPTDED